MKTGILKFCISFILLNYCFSPSNAQEIIAAEINYQQISYLTFSFEVKSISKFFPVDSILFDFGDGQADYAPASIQYLQNEQYLNSYSFIHTFAGPGEFTLTTKCGMMEAGLDNVFNSAYTPFFLTCTLNILDPLFFGYNSSPSPLSYLNQYYSVDGIYYSNFNLYDTDGDKFTYKFINGEPFFPYYTEIELPEASNTISIDSVTGEFIWDAPLESGRYLFMFSIEEYRNGYNIGNTISSFTIDHFTEENNIMLYPNPVSSELFIDLMGNNYSDYSITIFNSAGQIVKIVNEMESQNDVIVINLELLPSALYYLNFTSKELQKTYKFIKTVE